MKQTIINYLLLLLLCLISVTAMVTAWLAASPLDVFSHFIDEWWPRLAVGAGITVISLIIWKLIPNDILKVPFFLIALGAGIGCIATLGFAIGKWIGDLNPEGFFTWFGLFLLVVLLCSMFGGLFTFGLKTAFRLLLQLQFFDTLLYLIITISSGYAVLGIISGLMDLSMWLWAFCIISFCTGGISGFSGKLEENALTDENGQLHYIMKHLGNGSVQTTEGKTLHNTPGGNKEF